MAKTNPNNANQYIMDPRQKMCWEAYIDPRSETFGNAWQSAVKAGYEESYADVITTRPWFEEKVRRLNFRNKAEKVLEEMIEMADEQPVFVDGVEIGKKREPSLTKIKQDTAKFVVERLGKEDWSTRNEISGPDGEALGPFLFTWAKEHEDSKDNSDSVHSEIVGEEVSHGSSEKEVSSVIDSSSWGQDNSVLQSLDQASVDRSIDSSAGETA